MVVINATRLYCQSNDERLAPAKQPRHLPRSSMRPGFSGLREHVVKPDLVVLRPRPYLLLHSGNMHGSVIIYVNEGVEG
jgi:hypothetical protein